MNENPGVTPTPANSIPVAGNPGRATANPVATPLNSTTPTVPPAPTTTAEPVVPEEPTTVPEAEPAQLPEKKKKTGLIAGIIALVLLLVAGGVALAMFFLNKTDPVTSAINKIMSGNAPANVAIDGTINIKPNDEFSPISSIKIDLKSSANPSSLVNDSKAVLTADIRNVGEFTVEFDEVYTGDGDLYFRIDGAEDALEESGLLNLLNLSNQLNQLPDVVDCETEDGCQTGESESLMTIENTTDFGASLISENMLISSDTQNSLAADGLTSLSSLANIIEIIDGEWIKVSATDLNMGQNTGLIDSNISCITDLVSEADTGSSAAELYKKNPFITSTDKNVNLASKKYPVYRVGIDSKNLANFINSIQNSNISGNLYSCLGLNNTLVIDADSVDSAFAMMPDVYVEVDNNSNFTRLYLDSEIENDANITIDLNFSYPTNIDVSGPDEYVNLSDLFLEILSGIYDLPVDIYTEL